MSRGRGLVGALVILMGLPGASLAQKPPLLPEGQVLALANELSGETAKRNLEAITTNHRQRGSPGFHAAAELVADRLRSYGFTDVQILEFPADGKIAYGTQLSRPAWDAQFAELWQVNGGRDSLLLASYEAMPIVLAEDSQSGDVTAELVDVGEGTAESDYAGKEVKGKIVLVAAQPSAVEDLAVGRFGAAGIVSYAQNQHTAWWGEDENLIRWGHLETFSPNKTFGFMVSLKTARAFKARLAGGETIRLHAKVKASQHAGNYEVVTASIPGADPKLKEQEIAFSCHLDHQRPGANDNASGCVTILEVARTLEHLIALGRLPRPARTIRFIWPPEIEGTLALLNGKPELTRRIKAAIHMDMVGGGPATKSVFHVTRGPLSLPSFVHVVAWAFAEWVNQQSYKFAATGSADFPLTAPEGGKEPLGAQLSAYTMGSDHDVYQDSSFAIPSIYLNDWPDRYIHTNFDAAANIDPTKLKRAAFIGAASGYFLAGLGEAAIKDPSPSGLMSALETDRLLRLQFLRNRCVSLDQAECAVALRSFPWETLGSLDSLEWAGKIPLELRRDGEQRSNAMVAQFLTPQQQPSHPEGPARVRWQRKETPKGPLAVFGYDYFRDRARAVGLAAPKLLGYDGLWGSGEEYAYEVLNLANGRNTEEIRNAVSAEYGPVAIPIVVEYLEALEKLGIVRRLD
jgi:aminopeptidase YwaD